MNILVKHIFIIAILIAFSSCNFQQGHNGASNNIEESKDRGVFICEYTPLMNPYKINDTIILKIDEAWIEKKWKFPKNVNQTVVESEYQLCINIAPEKHIENLGIEWSIGVDYDKNMRISSLTSLIGDFKTLPSDTIEYKVQKGDEFSNNYEKIIIGKFILKLLMD